MSLSELPLDTQDAWTRARDRFIKDLTEGEKAIFLDASLENLFYTASVAQKTHQSNSVGRRIGSKLQPFVAAIDQYGKALDVYANTSLLILCPLWGSIRIVLHLASEFGKYFDKLVEMFVRIGDVLPRFRIYERLFPSHERLVQALSIVYLDIVRFCTDAKAIFRKARPSLLIAFKVTWRPFDQSFGRLLDDFRQHQKTVEREAGLSHMIEAKDARALERFNRLQIETERRESHRMKLLSRLPSVRNVDKHRKLCKLRHQRTGAWLTDSDQFRAWKSKKSSTCLCCYGIPGSGKTIAASSVIEHLSNDANSQSHIIAYHYCDYSNLITLQLPSILGTITRQLLINKDIIHDGVQSRLQVAFGDDRGMPDEAELLDLLCSVVDLHFEVYIIIDGMDECEGNVQDSLLVAIQRLAQFNTTIVKLYVSSREQARISNKLGVFPHVWMSEGHLQSDICTYVKETVRSRIDSGNLVLLDPTLEQVIVTELASKAQGMFLWVSLQLDEICDPTQSDTSIRSTLRDLPQGLENTYLRILQKIKKGPARTSSIAQKIFKWVICAKRHLTVLELKEAIAFEPTDHSWDGAKISTHPDHKALIQTCGNLVRLDEDDDTVSLAHHTVRQFLVVEPQCTVRDSLQFQFREIDRYVGEICVAYLSFSDFETQVTIPATRPKVEITSPIELSGLNYPFKKLTSSLVSRLYGGARKQEPFELDIKHLSGPPRNASPTRDMQSKYRLLNYVRDNWTSHTKNFEEEITGSRRMFGRLVLEKTLPFDFRPWEVAKTPAGPQHMSLFQWAVIEGHAPIMRQLSHVELSACWQSALAKGNSPLFDTARYGHNAVLRIFNQIWSDNTVPDKGIINRLSNEGLTALHLAAQNGHKETTQRLLSWGADIEQRSKYSGETALTLAAKHGQYETVHLLTAIGADIHASDDGGFTALHLAAQNGHKEITQRLLDSGADIEQRSKYSGETALFLAAKHGQYEIVHLLKAMGAEINVCDKSGHTALDLAVQEGRKENAEQLLHWGAKKFWLRTLAL